MTAISSSHVLDDSILFELDKIRVGSTKRRIVYELVEFKKNDMYIDAKYEENVSNIIYSTILVTIIPKGEDTIYSFNISSDYPFKPPSKFTINYKDYKQYLKIDSPKTIEEIRTYNDIKCLCCNTISCGSNWCPSLKMQSFINEFKQVKKYRRDIINRLLAKKIVEKYLVQDLNVIINEWLGL